MKLAKLCFILVSLGVAVSSAWSLYALFLGGAGEPGTRMGLDLVAPRGSVADQVKPTPGLCR